MVHPATLRAVRAAVTTLNVRLDVGFVFPPRAGEDRGYGQWTNSDLHLDEILAMLPRAAAANARGGNVYCRLGPSAKSEHPGIVMVDDLTADAVEGLTVDGLEPCLTVETSPGNFQAWITLVPSGTVSYAVMNDVARYLAHVYEGDERAVSPRQPGRLPGFTNRKPKHRKADGQYPYVLLTASDPGRVASKGVVLIETISRLGTVGAAARATPETPLPAASPATELDPDVLGRLDAIHREQHTRVMQEVAEGRRPPQAASQSEVDFAFARAALECGMNPASVVLWIARSRNNKGPSYAPRTVAAASEWLSDMGRPPKGFRLF